MSFPLRTRTRGRPGRNAGTKLVAAAPSFDPLAGWTTDPVHAFWASDPLWTPPADGGAVSSWRNGGSVGGDAVQATGGSQPLYRASTAAYNNRPTVEFDGTDDRLGVNIADISQTYYVVLIAGADTSASAFQCAFGTGVAASYGVYVAAAGSVYRMSFGTALTGGTATVAPHLFVAVGAGAASTLDVDGVEVIAAANAGTSAMPIIALGAGSAALATFGDHLNGHIAYAAVFTTDPTALPEWATFYAWVESYYNIPLP